MPDKIKRRKDAKLVRFARRRGVTRAQLQALVALIGWDKVALDAAIARLRLGNPAPLSSAAGDMRAE